MDPIVQNGAGLITGAGSGMGQEIAWLLSERGCSKLLLADVSEQGMTATKNHIIKLQPNAQIITQVTDVSNDSSVQKMVQECVSAFGRLDFAINCAGVARGSIKTTNTTVEIFDRICNVNEKGIFLCEKHEIKQMLQQEPNPIPSQDSTRAVRGAIVNIASMSATAALGELSAYTSSKHGVLGISKVSAREYAPHKIRINCVSPGFVNTPMMISAGVSEEFKAAAAAQAPMNRMTLAREVAEAVLFLVGSGASGITGANLLVDAGANLFHVM